MREKDVFGFHESYKINGLYFTFYYSELRFTKTLSTESPFPRDMKDEKQTEYLYYFNTVDIDLCKHLQRAPCTHYVKIVMRNRYRVHEWCIIVSSHYTTLVFIIYRYYFHVGI